MAEAGNIAFLFLSALESDEDPAHRLEARFQQTRAMAAAAGEAPLQTSWGPEVELQVEGNMTPLGSMHEELQEQGNRTGPYRR